MKDEYDEVTPDMFERGLGKKVSKIGGTSRTEGKTYGEEAAQNKAEKLPAKPVKIGGSGSSGTLPNDKGGLDRPHLYKKGGSVKSSASSRADGCAIKGKTKGRMV